MEGELGGKTERQRQEKALGKLSIKVTHKRLIAKLKAKGMNTEIRKWIEDWLDQRIQVVKVGREMTEEGDVGSEVPQGTVLGLRLFTVFIVDVDECLMALAYIIKFAIDSKCWKIIKNITDMEELQQVQDNLCK
jgi:hypothetical protein